MLKTNYSKNSKHIKSTCIGLTLLAATQLTGCFLLGETANKKISEKIDRTKSVDYRNSLLNDGLELPPEVADVTVSNEYNVPKTLSEFITSRDKEQKNKTVAVENNNTRLLSSGGQRWLAVTLPAEKVWLVLQDFIKKNGMTIAKEDAKLGFIQTDWLENHAKISQGTVRDKLTSFLGTEYSNGERDQYTFRLLNNTINLNGTPTAITEIFVSHKGMEEVLVERFVDVTKWQNRPHDSALALEIVRRLQIHLGTPEAIVQEQVKEVQQPKKATNIDLDVQTGLVTLTVPRTIDMVWREVGLILENANFTVTQFNPNQASFEIRYSDPVLEADREKQGIISKLFSKKEEVKATQLKQSLYTIQIRTNPNNQNQSLVTVEQPDGSKVSQESAKQILGLIYNKMD